MTWRRRLTRGAIATAVVGVIAVVSIPRMTYSTAGGNETSALAMLRNIHSAQLQFREQARADADKDGRGEYGFFGELSAECFVRGTQAYLDPPLLSGAFRSADANGVVSRSGYCFRIFLPGAREERVTERAPPKASVLEPRPAGENGCTCCTTRRIACAAVAITGPIDTNAAEERWSCYAWPAEPGRTGIRSFYINESGIILATEEPRDTPPDSPPSRDGRRWASMP